MKQTLHPFKVRQRRFELPRPLQALPPQSSASTSFATSAARTLKWTAKIALPIKIPTEDFMKGSNFRQDNPERGSFTQIRLFYK